MRRAAVIVVLAACGQDARIASQAADSAAAPAAVGSNHPQATPNEVMIASSEFDMGPIGPMPDPQVIVIRQHAQLRGFYIDRDPVTNAAYRGCVDAGACPPDCFCPRAC